jgi:hypothetical protein
MAFLNPLVLFALAAAAIPILIHLFNFRKPRRVDFSSLQFLRELERRTMRRMRLRQWLLLALRALALACLALAFARPVVQSGWAAVFGGRVETAMALVVDNSRSMTVRDAQGDLLTQAKELAQAVIEAGAPGDEVFVVPVLGGPARPEAIRQPGPALDAVAAVAAQDGAATVGQALARAFALLEGADLLNREALVLSDLQASTFLDTVRVPAPPGVRVTLLPLGERRHPNTAVTDVRIVSRVVEAGRPVQVEATLVHYGERRAEGVPVSLFLEGERVAQASADLAPGVPQTVRFTATPRGAGWLAGEVRLDPDAFPYDDVRHLVLHVPEIRRVLIVQGEGQRADLLALALSLGEEGRFAVTTVPEAGLAAQPLEGFDAVALVGPAGLASGERAALVRYVEGGGGLMLFPGERSAEALSALLAELGGGGYGPMLGAVGGQTPVARFGRADLDHPLFDGVMDGAGGRPIESPDVLAAMPPAPAAGQTLIALSGGQPFLHEVRRGQGTVLAFAVAPDPRWSDLPVRGLFVPLVHRAVALLAADAGAGEGLTVRGGGAIRVAGAAPGLRLVGPDGEAFAPEQRAVPGGVVLEVDAAVETPGVYAVTDGERVLRRVAFNADAAESDLTPLAPEEAARRLEAATGAEVRVLNAAGGRGLAAAERLAGEAAGVELWRLFLGLALVFLLAEQLVAMRWRPEAVPA